MTKVGRNHPCPCGSGKKYKHCCLARDEAAAVATREQQRRDVPPPPMQAPHSGWRPVVDDEGEQLDQMSNGILDLIDAGKLDEAEPLCRRLLDDFPEFPDGHMRLGQLFRARGEPKKAAQHLRLAAAVARSGDDDPEMPLNLEAQADSLDPPSS
jgi:tetratricopeptide (TPR) repeat protein